EAERQPPGSPGAASASTCAAFDQAASGFRPVAAEPFEEQPGRAAGHGRALLGTPPSEGRQAAGQRVWAARTSARQAARSPPGGAREGQAIPPVRARGAGFAVARSASEGALTHGRLPVTGEAPETSAHAARSPGCSACEEGSPAAAALLAAEALRRRVAGGRAASRGPALAVEWPAGLPRAGVVEPRHGAP
ncbi:unnamed protein product, partial [Prorocentrum cordatum]